jgi:hypothetical protein
LFADATVDAGEDRRSGQVRVGVGAADAVFDMPGMAGPPGTRRLTVRLSTPQVGASGA